MMLGLLSSGETRDGGGAGGPQVDAVRVSTVRGHARILRWDRGARRGCRSIGIRWAGCGGVWVRLTDRIGSSYRRFNVLSLLLQAIRP